MDGIASGRAHQYVSMQGVVYRASCSRHDELLREIDDVRALQASPMCTHRPNLLTTFLACLLS